ncbi:hypothetical protein [Sphingomonas trueperi]|uniref:hypothetical protein n=1 Tax=Sphingomonas trueperi TaxID=53317 RepID=UPI000F18C066
MLLSLLTVASLSTAAVVPAGAPQAGQCWFDAMSEAQKRDLVYGYIQVKKTRGDVAASAWAKQQRAAYMAAAEKAGTCRTADKAPAPEQEARAASATKKGDESCKRLELENVNVPNPGGSMGYALIYVCKD